MSDVARGAKKNPNDSRAETVLSRRPSRLDQKSGRYLSNHKLGSEEQCFGKTSFPFQVRITSKSSTLGFRFVRNGFKLTWLGGGRSTTAVTYHHSYSRVKPGPSTFLASVVGPF
jgi:hypothetical protein